MDTKNSFYTASEPDLQKINETFPLYVGSKHIKGHHICPAMNADLEKKQGRFKGREGDFVKNILICKSCHAIIIVQDDIEKLRPFALYKLYSAVTGEPITLPPAKPQPVIQRTKKLAKKKSKRPIKKYRLKHEEWYRAHPFQGGGCTGK